MATRGMSLAFSATQDAQSKPNMTFVWVVSQKGNNDLDVTVKFGKDKSTDTEISVTIPYNNTDSYSISASSTTGHVSISGLVKAIWGTNGAWFVTFSSAGDNNSGGNMVRSDFVNVYGCLASGITSESNGIIVGVNIPT